jgi:hypothetical protein
MSSTYHSQFSTDTPRFSSIPDPWDGLVSEPVTLPPHAWMIPPLDTSHELVGEPVHEAIAPHRAGKPIQSAVAILLADELKLAHQANGHLREEIGDAIALLELASESGR